MSDDEYIVYKQSTVEQVIFQIRFSNLFIIENKIGEFQAKIIPKFSDSNLIIKNPFHCIDFRSSSDISPPPDHDKSFPKTWQFKSDEGYILNVQIDSLSITS